LEHSELKHYWKLRGEHCSVFRLPNYEVRTLKSHQDIYRSQYKYLNMFT